ncbi:hypothetical protein BCR36DRAFT_586069 [Piromyces finnis]|uniref:Transmembrane protein n=1 Tax=Piromyces finnis TaxID=1754191 RepID=A0A1Y1V0S1_9FUNG|nr:hypothetical protein BCR36DRAFT_586069 [Piromyces finnis]|eukprot:ORX44707.1 hypothetical protein BCR36DRAFT_586069 [Piromyces finnis]
MRRILYNILLIISSVIANNLNLNIKREINSTFKYKNEIANVLQSLGFDSNIILTNASEQCLTSIENTYDCFQSVNTLFQVTNTNPQNFEEICNIYNSQSCDYFRNTVVSGNSGCVNQYDQMYFSLNFDMSIFYYVSTCTKNSKNEYCPAVGFYRNILSNDISNVTDFNKVEITNQSCNDNNCIDQMKKIIALTSSVSKVFELTFTLSGETQESLNQIKNALDVVAMDNVIKSCNNNHNNNVISNAMAINISLVFTIIIMMFSFLFFF